MMNEKEKKLSNILGAISIVCVFLLILIFSFVFHIDLRDFINDPYSHMNVIAIGVLSCVLIFFIIVPVIGHILNIKILKYKFFPQMRKKIPLSYKINVLFLIVEVGLLFYFALENNPLWYLFFMLGFVHILIVYRRYGQIIKEIDTLAFGREEAEKDYELIKKALLLSNVYFILIPIINLVEFTIGYLIIDKFILDTNKVIYLIFLVIIILIQDLIILYLVVFRKKKIDR